MPLYEYQCDACAHRFEVIQKFSDLPIEVCPSCGGTVRKLLSSPAIQFKGSGWYITDYARAGKSDGGGAAAAKPEPGSPSAPDASTSAAKSDAKPADTKSTDAKSADAKPASKSSASSVPD